MVIGLLGFEFEASNKGCEALSYAILSILDATDEVKPLELVVFNIHKSMGVLPSAYPNIKFKNLPIAFKNFKFWKTFTEELQRCDIVLDVTHGDSFSDIYGERWFFQTTLMKTLVLMGRKPLVLLPQTYGPFNSRWARKWAKWVVKKASMVFCRDEESRSYIMEMCGNRVEAEVAPDLAFALPYNVPDLEKRTHIRVGINISGLLWNNCKNGNSLGMATDYCDYCYQVLGWFSQNPEYEIYLVPHVICDWREGKDYYENDCKAIREVLQEYPGCILSPDFDTAIGAKSFIATLDILIAARMHASIAAYSAKVTSIPFAYSRKFTGIYEDLDYPYVIDGKNLSTDEAVSKTIQYILDKTELDKAALVGQHELPERQTIFMKRLLKTLMQCEKGNSHD